MNYGVTEVFIKHQFYSNLRVKLIRKDGENTILCHYIGDDIIDIAPYPTQKKLYQVPKGFLLVPTDENLFYIYESGEYSFLRYKYIKHVGSSRSSKSWSIEEALIRDCEMNPNYRITVWRDSQTSLGETVWKDFRKVFPLSGRRYKFTKDTRPIYFENGSMIEPHGDDTTNAHGLTQNKAWLNEPYRMLKDTFDQIDQRSEQIILDINPTGTHWSDDLETHPRCKVIHSTFQNNPFCPIDMKLKILSYDPSNPINIENGTADSYKWSVYGLGMKAEKPNRIFKWTKIPRSEFDKLEPKVELYGIDWGKNDPWGIIHAKYYDGALYLRELNYLSENKWRELLAKENPAELARITGFTPDGDKQDTEGLGIVAWMADRLKLDKKLHVICDNNRELKIAMLRRLGYQHAYPASKPKGSILDGITLLQDMPVYYTDDSPNLEYEQENYSWKVDRYGVVLDEPEDADNHCIDPARYTSLHLRRLGFIKQV